MLIVGMSFVQVYVSSAAAREGATKNDPSAASTPRRAAATGLLARLQTALDPPRLKEQRETLTFRVP